MVVVDGFVFVLNVYIWMLIGERGKECDYKRFFYDWFDLYIGVYICEFCIIVKYWIEKLFVVYCKKVGL